ncbi:unnamed protein product [Tuber melanosporum]|uniref:(Perigord truffle) hypothetical protein n=1 Tax=Tuber melanosporum (strain Mel28) TaxID=656061 RepID=D5GGW3_TUBMM|nr:uncharacterized protein GSTUM_00002067001 [Tuber melanosporum]CAZ83756.1 unnamed protein product [Tuber melanosporum]
MTLLYELSLILHLLQVSQTKGFLIRRYLSECYNTNRSLYFKLLHLVYYVSANIRNCSSYACKSLVNSRGCLPDPIQKVRKFNADTIINFLI